MVDHDGCLNAASAGSTSLLAHFGKEGKQYLRNDKVDGNIIQNLVYSVSTEVVLGQHLVDKLMSKVWQVSIH